MQSHEEIILRSCEDRWLTSLAFFYWLKTFNSNSTFYNYSARSLARQAMCSPTTINKHIKLLMKKGLIRRTGKTGENITLASKRRLKEEFGVSYRDHHLCTIRIYKDTSLNEIKLLLLEKLLHQRGRQQVVVINAKIKNWLFKTPWYNRPKKEYKAHQRFMKQHDLNERFCNKITFTDQTLGEVMHCSTRTAARRKKSLRQMGLISTLARMITVGKNNGVCLVPFTGSGHVFLHKGKYIKQYPTEYSFNTYSVGSIMFLNKEECQKVDTQKIAA